MQKYIDRIECKIKTLPTDTIFEFSEAKVDGVPVDTLRKTLHRLHDKGIITIVKKGHFQRIEPFRELLFVYGSLKKGFDNHKVLSKFSKRLGKAKTVKKFGMFEDNFGNYPYLIDKSFTKIQGELYEIQRRELLDKIDKFEGAPDYYERKRIEVKSHHGKKRAFVYIKPNKPAPIDQEPLTSWQNQSKQKLKQLHTYLDGMIKI